ncbi:MAG: hypothetical protein ABI353_01515, partial [Isosphaeraceae bacterium]
MADPVAFTRVIPSFFPFAVIAVIDFLSEATHHILDRVKPNRERNGDKMDLSQEIEARRTAIHTDGYPMSIGE